VGHDLAIACAEFDEVLVVFGHAKREGLRFACDRASLPWYRVRRQMLGDEVACRAAIELCESGSLRDDANRRIEVQILDVRIQLGADVVAQPLRIHPDREIAQRADAVPRDLDIFSPGHGDEAMRIYVIGHLVGGPANFSMAGQNSVWK